MLCIMIILERILLESKYLIRCDLTLEFHAQFCTRENDVADVWSIYVRVEPQLVLGVANVHVDAVVL